MAEETKTTEATSAKLKKGGLTGLFIAIGLVFLGTLVLIGDIAIAAVALPYNSGLVKTISKMPGFGNLIISDEKKGRMAMDTFWTNIKSEETRRELYRNTPLEADLAASVRSNDIPSIGKMEFSVNGSLIAAEKNLRLNLKLNVNIGGIKMEDIEGDAISTENFLYIKINDLPDYILEMLAEKDQPQGIRNQKCIEKLEGQWYKIPKEELRILSQIQTIPEDSCFTNNEKIEKLIEELEKHLGADKGKFVEVKSINGKSVFVFEYDFDLDDINSILKKASNICGENKGEITEEDFSLEVKKFQLGVDAQGRQRYIAIELTTTGDEGKTITVSIEETVSKFGEAKPITAPKDAKNWREISHCFIRTR